MSDPSYPAPLVPQPIAPGEPDSPNSLVVRIVTRYHVDEHGRVVLIDTPRHRAVECSSYRTDEHGNKV